MKKIKYCSKGHDYTVDNTITSLNKVTGRYKRRCKVCVLQYRKDRWLKIKGESNV